MRALFLSLSRGYMMNRWPFSHFEVAQAVNPSPPLYACCPPWMQNAEGSAGKAALIKTQAGSKAQPLWQNSDI